MCCEIAGMLNTGNGAGQHQHMAISEEQSRLMDSQSQPTTGGLGSEIRGFNNFQFDGV